MKKIELILMGLGNVGKAFFRLVREKRAICRSRYGIDLRFRCLFRREGAFVFGTEKEEEVFVDRWEKNPNTSHYWNQDYSLDKALESVRPGVLVECTPSNLRTGEPALGNISKALDRKWHVACANKGPLVIDLKSLKSKAKKNGVALKFSAAAGAALPALDAGFYSLAGTEIIQIEGILNGTTNYILTRMGEGLIYDEALGDAQTRGIAEHDPSLDVEGWDTASKMVLIANDILNTEFNLDEVEVEGITHVSQHWINEEQKEKRKIKLMGKLYREDSGYRIEVKPESIDSSHPLFEVDGTNKGITFLTDTMGAITITGGKSDPLGAAAALLKDIINIYRRQHPQASS